ncbi:HlyD family secretion protein [Rubripirellula reticaptiva]|uniref:Inner membrane protein YibH n=1 Tax=Rubripirellula reticaptiva TaxID=2528013 RepID=A0A5C6F4P3_9BACT|nr:biotin/lipoyl-binding protein [Rubripirellula reticaptiva]TWU56318.1 Inner membrane protein YibH [Rubripirellula reticaptiva]
MSWLLAGMYCGVLWLVFAKLKLIRLSLPIAIVAASVGPALIVALLFCAQYYHPFTSNVIAFEQVVPIAAGVNQRGRVIEVAVTPNVPVKSGDVLFRVDPVPYKNTIRQLTASLEQANQSKEIAEASVVLAETSVTRATSSLELATKTRDREQKLMDQQAGSQQSLDNAINAYNQADAALVQANTNLSQANLAVSSAAAQIVQMQTQLDTANYQLDQTTVVAPSDGYVVNLQLREGMMVGAVSGPVLSFVLENSQDNRGVVVASFNQKNYLRIKPGQYTEVALNNYPGEILTGRVINTIDVSGAGQLTASGLVPTMLNSGKPSAFAVRIKLDDADAIRLPGGTQAIAAVYTEDLQIAGLPVMFLIRAQSWLRYLL